VKTHSDINHQAERMTKKRYISTRSHHVYYNKYCEIHCFCGTPEMWLAMDDLKTLVGNSQLVVIYVTEIRLCCMASLFAIIEETTYKDSKK